MLEKGGIPIEEVVVSNEIISEDGSRDTELAVVADMLLSDVRGSGFREFRSLSIPFTELSTLGSGVSSLLPAFRTVTQTSTVDLKGYFQLANAEVGDRLKVAKNGNFWGAFHKANGGSKFAQLKAAEPMSVTNSVTLPVDPATMLMAGALFSIQKELGNIAEMEKQILSFLEIEKEAEIEADILTLVDIITKYKHNWDNERFIASNHKLVCDIQRTARKNMVASQKKVAEALKAKPFMVSDNSVNLVLQDLENKYKYYRTALYTFAMASFVEVMLSGNFSEKNICQVIEILEKCSSEYRDLFGKCSEYLERISLSSVESTLWKGLGFASDTFGKFIGSIPKVRDGQVDEFLLDQGKKIKRGAEGIKRSILERFAEVSNPGTGTLIEKLRDMDRIYNHTKVIGFDRESMFLIA